MMMFKKLLAALLALSMLLAVPALAGTLAPKAWDSGEAVANQDLYLRTGPNTMYAELGWMPQSTDLLAIQYEEGNGVTWVLVEYWDGAGWVRGYTGLKRMTVYGDIPWAQMQWAYGYMTDFAMVYSAPYESAHVRTVLDDYSDVTILQFENGYAFIEFVDEFTGELTRGYVESGMVAYAY